MPPAAQIRPNVFDVIVLGAGPAGVLAALRAAELGARTALVTAAEFGGMAANDGPVPVRTLAFAARLMRDARQLPATASPRANLCCTTTGCWRACAKSCTT